MSWKDRGKLSPEDIAEIVALSKTTTTQKIADQFKINRKTVHYHLKRVKIIIWKRRKEIENKNPKGVNPSKELKNKKSKRKQGRGLNAGKSYREFLEIENEKRKKAGLWLYKPSKNKL